MTIDQLAALMPGGIDVDFNPHRREGAALSEHLPRLAILMSQEKRSKIIASGTLVVCRVYRGKRQHADRVYMAHYFVGSTLDDCIEEIIAKFQIKELTERTDAITLNNMTPVTWPSGFPIPRIGLSFGTSRADRSEPETVLCVS